MHRIKSDPIAFSKAFLNWTPHEKQKEILAATVDPECKNVTISAGRRAGKTECVSIAIIHYSITHKDSIQFIIAPTNEQAAIIFNKILRFLSQNEDIKNAFVSDVKRSPFPIITFVNKSQLHFRSAQHGAQYIRGHGERCHRVIIDEAAFVDDMAMVQGVIPLLFDTGGQLIKISTPAGRNHFYDSYIKGAREEGLGLVPEKGYTSIRFPSTSNPHLPAAFLEDKKREYGSESIFWKTEIEANFLDDKAAVFPWSWVTRAFTSRPFPILKSGQKGEIYVMGVDVAEQTDYNVLTTLRINPTISGKEDEWDLDIVDMERFHQQGLDYTAKEITSKLFAFKPSKCVIDQTGQIGNPMLELIPSGDYTIEPLNINPKNKAELVKYLSTSLERNELHIQSNDETEILKLELKFFQYRVMPESQRIRYSAPPEKHDDAVMSLALAIYAAKNTPRGPGFIETSPKDVFLETMERDYNAPSLPNLNEYEEEKEEDNFAGVVVG